jgi:ASPIC and UnbV/FG-GAP-like repeat
LIHINNNNVTFIPPSGGRGLADSSQTWVTEFQDIDNDGDMDAFIANHHSPSRLMLNDGTGHFTDITAASGLLGNTPDGILQALMRDFDNDGYVDLIVSGMMGAKYFKNNGNRTFTALSLPLLNTADNLNPLRSFAIGDLNHDGFQDIYASYYYGNPDPDQLWLNGKNTNHFLAINLTGTQSNRSAVGARITIKSGNQTQIREVRAGESYGISNSLTQYVGLGNNTTIDNIEVRWPSGQRTTIQNPTADQFLNITEPLCSNTICIPVTTKIIKL